MSEDKTPAVTETVSESPATETTQDSSSEQYIAESKKYRNRAQVAETELAKLKSVNSLCPLRYDFKLPLIVSKSN